MKVLSFSYCFPNEVNPSWGIFVEQRLSALSERVDLKVCAPMPWFPFLAGQTSRPQMEEWKDLEIYRPGFFYIPKFFKNSDASLYALGLKSWLRDLCRTWQPDILDAHFVWPDGVGVARLAQELGLPYVITLRGKIYECLKVQNQTRQCRRALTGAAAVISVSSRMAEEARQLGVDAGQLNVIPNGVDLDHFYPRDQTACREKLNLPLDRRLLVTVAHLGHRKGHHEVIEALANLPDDVSLVIVGGAAQGGDQATLKAVADKFKVTERLILPGRQDYDLIPYYYNAADVSVLASYREGCPNVVLESLACGTPVVATDVGAVPDILPVPGVGRIVPPQQVEPLTQALLEALEQQWDAETIRTNSGVRSWNQVALSVQQVFSGILGKK